MIRVVVVEDVEGVREAIVATFREATEARLDVVGQAGTCAEARGLPALAPDVALVDLRLPDGSGHDIIRTFRERAEDTRCLVLTALDDRDALFEALRAGAKGYVLKDAEPEELVAAVIEVHAGGSPITPRMARFMVERFASVTEDRETAPELTEREREVLHLLTRGLTYSEVASLLGISKGTIQSHVKNLYRKLEVCTKAEAVGVGLRYGLVE